MTPPSDDTTGNNNTSLLPSIEAEADEAKKDDGIIKMDDDTSNNNRNQEDDDDLGDESWNGETSNEPSSAAAEEDETNNGVKQDPSPPSTMPNCNKYFDDNKVRSQGGTRLTSPITNRRSMMMMQRGGSSDSRRNTRGEEERGTSSLALAPGVDNTAEEEIDELAREQPRPSSPPREFSTEGIIPGSTTNFKASIANANPLRASRIDDAQRALTGNATSSRSSSITKSRVSQRGSGMRQLRASTGSGISSRTATTDVAADAITGAANGEEKQGNANLSPRRLSPAANRSISWSPGGTAAPTLSPAARRAAVERKTREMFAMPPLSPEREETTADATEEEGSNGANYRNEDDNNNEGGIATQLSGELEEEDLFVPGAYSVPGTTGDQISSSLEWSLMEMNYSHNDNDDNNDVSDGNRIPVGAASAGGSSRPATSSLGRNGRRESSSRDLLVNAVLVEEDEEDDASEELRQRRKTLQAWENELQQKQRELERLDQSFRGGGTPLVAHRTPSVVAEAIVQHTPKQDYLAKAPGSFQAAANNKLYKNKITNKNYNDDDGGGKMKAAVTSEPTYQESLFTTFKRQSGPFLALIASRLHTTLDIKDRSYHLKTFKRCFVACEAVDCMVELGITDSRKEAVLLGRLLQDVIGFWHHVCHDHDFDDEYLFFRLQSDEEDMSSLSTTGTPPPPKMKEAARLKNKKIKNPLRKILNHNSSSIDELDSMHSRSSRSSGVTEEDLSSIASRLLANLDIKDRTYRLKKYKRCFVACEAVDVMINMGIANSRDEAVLLGWQLQDTIGFWNHVCGDHQFKDQFLFFRLSCDEADLNSRNSTKNKKKKPIIRNNILHQSRSSGGTTERISDDSIRSFSSTSERDIVESGEAEHNIIVP